ncbi:MAG TPA: BamA/TamA family outer membrane protein [Myxococcota bacterium]
MRRARAALPLWLGVALLGAASAAPAAAPAGAYDPLKGVEPSGRIPKPELPPDLPNPERWRYIPEGRLKPGNVLSRLMVSSFLVPYVFVESDIGIGGGLALTDIDFRQQRRREFAGAFVSYTSKGQQAYVAVWRRWHHHIELPEGGVLQEERSFWRARGGYSKTLTRRFFGLGATTDEDDESSYTDEQTLLDFGVSRAIPDPGDNLVVDGGVRLELHHLSEGEVSDVPATGDAFPRAFAPAQNADLGWIEASVAWDTRDSQENPYRGWNVVAGAEGAVVQRGGDAGGRFTLSATKILPLPGLLHSGGDAGEENPPTDTLALNFWTQAAAGDLPFFALPTLGGTQRLRGYVAGRWHDRSAWFGGAEYRFWILPRGFGFAPPFRVERAGAALFAEAGSVAGDWPDLFSSRVRFSYGVSLRMTLERAAPFRLDFGFSDEGMKVTARFGLSF